MAEGPPRYRRTAVIEQVGVVRANPAPERAWARVAGMAAHFGDEAYAEFRKRKIGEAEQAGLTAGISRDADGRLVFQPVEATDDAARAYNRAGKAAYLASFANDTRARASELAVQHSGDPEAFRNAWSGHVQGSLEGMPADLRPDASIYLDQQGTQFHTQLLNRRVEQDRAFQSKTVDTQLKALEGDLLSLARAGKLSTPEYQAAIEQRTGLLKEAIGGRLISAELAEEMNKGLQGEITAQAFIGDVLAGYRKRGGGADATRWAFEEADKLVNDPKSLGNLSPGQRERFKNLLQGEIREAESIRQIGWTELERRFRQLDDDIALGVVPKGLASLRAEAKGLGHAELVDQIDRVEAVGQATAAFARRSLPDQSADLAVYEDRWLKGELNPTERSMYVSYSRAHERAVREVKADPVRYAMRTQGDVPAQQRITPLSFDDLSTLPAQLQARAEQMRISSGRIGIGMPLLTKEESRVIASTVTAPDDPAAAQTAARRFDMVRPILASAQTDDQMMATQRALAEAGLKDADLLAADPEMVAHLGVSGARRLFGALTSKEAELPADVKKEIDSKIAELWRAQFEFNMKQGQISGDGTTQRRQELSWQMLKRTAYSFGDGKQAYTALFGASVLLEGDDYALRLPKAHAEDRQFLEAGMAIAKQRFADVLSDDPVRRRQAADVLQSGQWTNDRDGTVGLYVGGVKFAGMSVAELVERGRTAQATAAAELEAEAKTKRESQPRRGLDLNFGKPVR